MAASSNPRTRLALRTRRSLSSSRDANAIRTDSLSKVGWLGLRTGWLIADTAVCAEITPRRRSQFDLGPAVPSQLAALAIMQEFDALAATRREQVAAR